MGVGGAEYLGAGWKFSFLSSQERVLSSSSPSESCSVQLERSAGAVAFGLGKIHMYLVYVCKAGKVGKV